MKNLFLIICLVLLASIACPARATSNDLPETKAEKILVSKSDRMMYLFNKKGDVFRAYRVSLGKSPIGHKQREGDGKTPEGRYTIVSHNKNSSYHLSLRISYPTIAERSVASRRGQKPGGEIFIHGLPNGKEHMTNKYNKTKDWTNGCIAVNNDEIEEIWHLVPDGTPITILP